MTHDRERQRLHDRPSSQPPTFDLRDMLWLLLLTCVTLIVLGKDITKGGLRSLDAPVHAMDGVLIHDWVGAGPSAWSDPLSFAVEQYAHYPSLSIGQHYPPGFAVVEAAFFAMFGISATTARLSVVAMGVLAVAGVYVFGRRFAGRGVCALAGAILVSMPAVTIWGRQTMLELPTLAVMIWTAVALAHYLGRPTTTRLGILVAMTLLSLCFKQNAVFLIGAVTAAIGTAALRGAAPKKHAAVCVVLTLIIPALVWLSLGNAVGKLVSGYQTIEDPWSYEALTFYLWELPGQVNGWFLVAAMIGAVATARRLGVYAVFLAAWLAGCYAMVTLADCKQPRFFFVGLFPFALWASLATGALVRRLPARAAASVVILAIAIMTKLGYDRPIEYFPDHGSVVIAHRERIENHAVLFSGLRDGDFVFAVRQHVPWRKAAVIRASKLLYTCTAHPNLDFDGRVEDLDDIKQAILPLALSNLFVERENRLGVAEDELFRDYVVSSRDYKLIDSRRLCEEPEPSYRNVTMDVYGLAVPRRRSVEYVDIPVPRANRTIRLHLDRWSG